MPRFKDFDAGLKEKTIFVWSKCGAFLFLLFSMRSRSARDVVAEAVYWMKAQLMCIRHWREIKRGDFGFITINMDK